MADISVTAAILDGVEQRTLHQLAALEVPEYGAIYKASHDGSTTLVREGPELPGGRELLAHVLNAGYSPRDRAVQVAKEAAIAELLVEEAQASEEPEE